MRAWCADTGRFLWGLLYWNFRKQRYLGGRRKGLCPCHDPSDSGRPGETHCEAVLTWNRPTRFRRICPLLRHTPAGWCCSVAAQEVRPFWGRALAHLGLAGVLLYLLGGLVVFAGLQGMGVRTVAMVDLWWPGRWSHIKVARAELFLEQALHALGAGDARKAYVALSAALNVDPENYRARLLMAQINQFEGAVLHSDAVFQELAATHPEKFTATALTYHDTLLALGRMDRLAEFCLQMTKADPGQAVHWVQSLLMALRLSRHADEFSRQYAAQLDELAPHARLLVQAEALRQKNRRAEARELLRKPYLGPLNPVFARLHIAALRRLQDIDAAWLLYDYYNGILPPLENGLVQYQLAQAAGDRAMVRLLWGRTLQPALKTADLARILAVLIENPDQADYRQLHARVLAQPGLVDVSVAGGLWVAALVCGTEPEAEIWAKQVARLGAPALPDITAVDFTPGRRTGRDSVFSLINQTTLPREVIGALLLRQAEVPSRAGTDGPGH